MKVLVTGGTGYIGSHTCVELLGAGHEVMVVDNLSNSKETVLNRIARISGRSLGFVQADVRDKAALRAIFSTHGIDAVIHFAGLKSVGESVSNPMSYYDNNVVGTLVLCEVMTEFGVKKLVFSSSATVYGNPDSVPIGEEAALAPTNPYGRSKLIIEMVLRDLCMAGSDWDVVLLRYFNPVGAHASGLIGEDPHGIPNNLVPYISRVAAGVLPYLSVFGGDWPTADGTGVRDYIHVTDLATGHLRALEKLQSDKGIFTYNLGTGRGYSVLEMIKTFERVSGRNVPYRVVARRTGDIAVCYANASMAYAELRWRAEKNIDDMCADVWRWQNYAMSAEI